MDPEGPAAGFADGRLLDDVDDELIDTLIAHTVGRPLVSVEIRHLGGAVARSNAAHGALASLDAPYGITAAGATPTDELYALVRNSVEALREALATWEAQREYLNLASSKRDARSFFAETAYHRLRRVKAKYDPANVIRSNHELEPDESFC